MRQASASFSRSDFFERDLPGCARMREAWEGSPGGREKRKEEEEEEEGDKVI